MSTGSVTVVLQPVEVVVSLTESVALPAPPQFTVTVLLVGEPTIVPPVTVHK